MKTLRELEENTGYPIFQNNGQRVCGPPEEWSKPVPGEGSEIFIGNLPRSINVDDLMQIFSSVGDIYVIRLMVHYSGFNRGFAFITYEDSKKAALARKYFNNFLIQPNATIGVHKSVDNRRLFVGGIPQDKAGEAIQLALQYHVNDIKKVIMYPPCAPYSNATLNRGYVFVEFHSHRSAAIARRILNSGITLWEDAPLPLIVDWANPIPEVDSDIMQTVKRLYMSNVPYDMTNEELQEHLSHYIPAKQLERVHKMHHYAFLHFQTRRAAEIALSVLKGIIIDGYKTKITWCRPQSYSKESRANHPPENLCKSVPWKMRRHLQQMHGESQPTPRTVTSEDLPPSTFGFNETASMDNRKFG